MGELPDNWVDTDEAEEERDDQPQLVTGSDSENSEPANSDARSRSSSESNIESLLRNMRRSRSDTESSCSSSSTCSNNAHEFSTNFEWNVRNGRLRFDVGVQGDVNLYYIYILAGVLVFLLLYILMFLLILRK